MIQYPSRLLDSDPDARAMVTEFKGVRMPDLGLSDEQVQTLVELLTICSAQKCDLKGKFVPVTEAKPADVALGVELFLGRTALSNGGPACVSCHTLEGVGSAIEGGTLAKELTHSFATLGDEGLDAALKNPTFPLMNKVYGDAPLNSAEAFALRAALYDANRGALTGDGQRVSVVLIAALIALLSLAGLNAAWSRRKQQGVRESLVAKEQQS
jgi:cytochrome c peroxidase